MEVVADGYVIVGNMTIPREVSVLDSIVTVVFKADKDGSIMGDFHYFFGGTGKSIKQLPNGGYIIVGDRIERELNPEFVANSIVSSLRILVLNDALEEVYVNYKGDDSPAQIKTDFYGGTVTVSGNGEIIVLGTYVDGIGSQINIPEKPFIVSYSQNPDNSLAINWTQTYNLIDRNYRNSRSVYIKNNKIIWASGIARIQSDVTFSYVTIPVVESNSVFVNNSTLGETNDQLFIPRDIQPSNSPAFGYGVVGSYSEPNATDGSKSNMFFLRVDQSGNIIDGSTRFFDAILSKDNISIDSTLSEIVDEGEALTSTSDGGFVLAGSMETIPSKGNGNKDIFLVKVDAFGNPVWNKTIGGSGNEVVSSIKETPDGGLLICGTNTLGGTSIAFLIKTDKNGELKN
jgi:hypothetical protein